MRWACLSLIVLGCGCTEVSKNNSSPTASPSPSSNQENFDSKLANIVANMNKIVGPSENTKVKERRKPTEKSVEIVGSPAKNKKYGFLLASSEKSYTKKAAPTTAMPTCDMPMGVLPSARGCCDESGPYVMGSFLYWRGQFTAIPVTISEVVEPGGVREFGTEEFPHYRYKPGFKIGLGYNFSYDAWDLLLDWTWFRAHSQRSLFASEPIFSQSTLSSETTAPQVEHHGFTRYNSVDLELGRVFYVGKRVSLRPFVGGKTFWLKFSIIDEFLNAIEGDSDDIVTDAVNFNNGHTWAIGPRFGVNSRWILGKSNFAFLLNTAGSLIWQKFHQFTGSIYTTNGLTQGGEGPVRLGNLNPVAEIFAGFDWGYCFTKTVYLNLSAGYEMQYLAGQIVNVFGTEQAFNMMGLTASFRLDF